VDSLIKHTCVDIAEDLGLRGASLGIPATLLLRESHNFCKKEVETS